MKGYFQFTRRQKIGVAALGTIILFLVVLLNVNHHRALPDPSDVDVSGISFVQAENEYDSNESEDDYDHSFSSKSDFKKAKLFQFDPNTLNQKGWEDLGFSEKQAGSIVKYRSSYGPFKKPEDVQKIYVVSDEKYTEIQPFMTFTSENLDNSSDLSNTLIDINNATQEELETIHGIGPSFAKRAIKYRQLLGGFASKDQYSEIYGITEEALLALESNTLVDDQNLTKVKINSASKDEIKKHPYLRDWAVVAEIISQRDKSKLEDLSFLLDKELMTQDELNIVLPYVSFK